MVRKDIGREGRNEGGRGEMKEEEEVLVVVTERQR